jgi:CHAT domain-containing protein
LTSVFFYAAALAVLVSQLEVYSEPTVKLIISAVRALSDSSVGRVEALRRAMLNMIDNGKAYEGRPSNGAGIT